MGTTFWIFVAIAVIQGIASMAAKSAEKRKKAERRAAMAKDAMEGRGEGPAGAYRSKAELEEKLKASGNAQKVIAAMLGFPEATSSAETAETKVSASPKAAQPVVPRVPRPVPSGVGEANQAEIEAMRRRRLETMKKARRAATKTSPQTPAVPSSDRGAIESTTDVANEPQRRAAAGPVPSSAIPSMSAGESRGNRMVPRSGGRTRASVGSMDVPKLWRSPDSIRQAIILSELLKPPVALRDHQAGGH